MIEIRPSLCKLIAVLHACLYIYIHIIKTLMRNIVARENKFRSSSFLREVVYIVAYHEDSSREGVSIIFTLQHQQPWMS